MDKKTQGAWIIHHTDKLQDVKNAANDYENINLAGKCGLLLSSLAASEEMHISQQRLETLAKAANINLKMELPTILNKLEQQKLIIPDSSIIHIIGLTTSATLEHITSIFYDENPDDTEIAVIDLSEQISELPQDYEIAKEYISDIYKISNKKTDNLLNASREIGFIDGASLDNSRTILFNGNLFRRDDIQKINAVYSSLSESEISRMKELNELLKYSGCLPLEKPEKIVGEKLFEKLKSIGIYDVNTLKNERGKHYFVTKPSAFSKFGNSAVEDVFDLAKLFVTSLTFGMMKSPYDRGQIKMIQKLMEKLINGDWVGSATAIGNDYKALEFRGVVQVKRSPEDSNRYNMKLLKKDVGELALKVINNGEISTEAAIKIPTASIIDYTIPEQNRTYGRKSQNPEMDKNIAEMLEQLRRGV